VLKRCLRDPAKEPFIVVSNEASITVNQEEVKSFAAALITVLLFLGLGPIGDLPRRTRYASATVMAVVTMACSWYGHSSTPGTTIYLKEAQLPHGFNA
jgi:hypothetical protein